MAVNDPQRMLMVLHPSAKTILGANNLAFLHGPEHKAMRKSFVSLFTRKALSTYTELQVGGLGWGHGMCQEVCRSQRSRQSCDESELLSAHEIGSAGRLLLVTLQQLLPFRPGSNLHTPRVLLPLLQDGIIRRHLNEWMKRPEVREMRDDVRCGCAARTGPAGHIAGRPR